MGIEGGGKGGGRESARERMAARAAAPRHTVQSIALPAISQGASFDPSLWDRKPAGVGAKRLAPVAARDGSEALPFVDLQPAGRRAAPAMYSQLKPMNRASVGLPRATLAPAKLISIDPARAAAAAARERARAAAAVASAAPSARASFASAAGASRAAAPAAPTRTARIVPDAGEPLWHAIFFPTGERPAERRPPPTLRATLPMPERSRSSDDWAAAGDIDIADLTDSRDPFAAPRIEPPRRPLWMWQWVEGLFLSKTFARALAATTIILFASAIDAPWRDWVNRQAARVTVPVASAVEQLSRPVQERAAFFIVDDFTSGIDHWVASRGLRVGPAGWLAISSGVSLNGETVRLQDYRLDFDAKIQSAAVGWIVRAPDTSNYYAFKLREGGTPRAPTYTLSRYALLDGVRTARTDGIPVPEHLARAEDFNRISVRVVGDRVTTLINGWGVDHWRETSLPRGGVGLLADEGESALVRKMTISGNDDTWGLILYGALESANSLRNAFSRSSAPAAIVFLQPIGAVPTMALGAPTTAR